MILSNPSDITRYLSQLDRGDHPNTDINFDRILMVDPKAYEIKYAINPYMQQPDGNLKQVDRPQAQMQWEELKHCFENLGMKVFTLPSDPELPDMVYAANQVFPFWDAKERRPKVLLSQMRSLYRQPEVRHFATWLTQNGYEIVKLTDPKLAFEGNGDALVQPRTGIVWGGYGPRTDRAVYDELSSRFDLKIVPLELRSQTFYHLDTCFSILNRDTVAYQRDAFSLADQKKIEAGFKNCIPLDLEENIHFFAGNCYSPNGSNVILQRGASKFVFQLVKGGFQPIEVETSEFIKGGGSVFCLKMPLFSPRGG